MIRLGCFLFFLFSFTSSAPIRKQHQFGVSKLDTTQQHISYHRHQRHHAPLDDELFNGTLAVKRSERYGKWNPSHFPRRKRKSKQPAPILPIFAVDDFSSPLPSSVAIITSGSIINNDTERGYCLQGSMQTPLDFQLPLSYTKMAWIKMYSKPTKKCSGIASSERGGTAKRSHYMSINYRQRLEAGHASLSHVVDPSSIIVFHTWYHVAVTYDHPTGILTLYRNGVARTSEIVMRKKQSWQGGDYVVYSNSFDGCIDGVRIYNKALSSNEIITIHSTTRQYPKPTTPPPVPTLPPLPPTTTPVPTTTQPPTTTTEIPTTTLPPTTTPTTEIPATSTTSVPTTTDVPIVTEAPITTTNPPVEPTTQAPTTLAPTTSEPTTPVPTTTPAPTATPVPTTTSAPTTVSPTFQPTIPAPLVPDANPITYHNGLMLTAVANVYLVYYGNWATLDPVALTLIPEFVSNLGGSSVWNIETTYYQRMPGDAINTYLPNDIHYVGYATDTSYAYGTTISDSAVYYIIKSAVADGRLPPVDNNGIYMVLTSPDVHAASGMCSTYCGWHTSASLSGRRLRYGLIGSSIRCNGCLPPGGTPNNARNADAMISVLYHELAEVVTDPDFTAWYDNTSIQSENGDRCAWKFGNMWTSANGAKANARLGSRDYLLQMMWVNAYGGYCVNRWD